MMHTRACLQPSRVTALSHLPRAQNRPARCNAACRTSSYGSSKALSAAPVAPPSSKAPARRMAITTRAQAAPTAAAAAAPLPDSRVTWDVGVITHIPYYESSNIGLQLTVISVDGKRREFQLEATKPPQKVERDGKDAGGKDLPGRLDSFAIKLPNDFEPAAVWVEDKEDRGDKLFQAGGDYSRLYLKVITMNTGSSSSESICFIANTYISTQQGNRQFVRDDALSNPQLAGNKVLAALMADELQQLRGEGKNENEARDNARKDPDRIYRYATYNDLGGDIVKTPGNIREPLGGSSTRPYPRRIDTNRGTYPGTNYELAPGTADGALVTPGVIRSTVASIAEKLPQPLKGVLLGAVKVVPVDLKVAPTPWTPQDDNFDTDKTRGFIGNAVTGVLPGAFTSIDAALGNRLPWTRRLLQLLKLAPGKEFDNIGEVLSLYDKQQIEKLSEGGVMAEAVPEGGSAAFGAQLLGIEAGKVNRRTGEQAKEADKNDSVLDLLKYDVPRSLENRLSTWSTDEEMGRMYLAGQNPLTIEVLGSAQLQQLLEGSAGISEAEPTLKGKLEGKSMLEWAAAGDTGEEPRLFVVDYWAIYGLLDTLESVNAGSDRVMHAGRCVMFRRSDGHLVPVIIELAHSTKQPIETYTSNDPPAVWQVAKAIFQSVDSGWHQLISHWLRTHACVEPYLIATRRRLPAAHPMFRLLMPHFRYTLPINAAARGSLINAGGVIEQNFSPGPFSMQLSSIVYGLTWRFKDEGHPADLKKRGFLDAAGKLRVKDYPFAEDGLLIWEALHKYFTAYVALYYANDAAVAADTWLQEWWTEVKTEAHPQAPADGWVDLDSRSNLVFAVCTMAWVASAHHAAVNFGQYDYSGWMPSHSSLCRRPAPARGSDAWQKLSQQDVSSKEMFSYIAEPATATKVMSTVKLLSAHAQDEQYLSTNAQSWLPLETDPAVKAVFDSFVADIQKNVEPEIDRRNADPANVSRNPATGGMRYTLLYPSSDPGVTMQGVPYSISI